MQTSVFVSLGMACDHPPSFPNSMSNHITGNRVNVNSTITYTCDRGYKIREKNIIEQNLTCVGVNNSVVWEDVFIECEGIPFRYI